MVFKNRDHVETTINELDVVKSRLAGRQIFDRVGIEDWQICKGIPSDDIIWPNVGKLFFNTPF